MKRKPTIVDIAAKVGITPSAVSKAFSNHPKISTETKRKVSEAAEALGYKRNSLATGLRNGKSGLIGVLVPGVHYSFFSGAIKGIEEALSEHGYNVIIVQTRDSQQLEERQIDGLMKARVEGVIASLAINTIDYEAYTSLSKEIPLVMFDRTFSHDGISEVMINDFGGAVLAVNHLISMGYKRIAHLAGLESIRPFSRRIEGYKFALSEAGRDVREEFIFQCPPNDQIGATAMEKLMALDEPPDAVFCASDYLAYGAMQTVLKKGLSVPRDIGIVGFSNEAFSHQVTPSITTVDQFSETLGAAASEILLEHLEAIHLALPFVAQQRIIEPALIVRESSSRINSLVNQNIL